MVIAPLRTVSQRPSSFPAFRTEADTPEWGPTEQFIPSQSTPAAQPAKVAASAAPASSGQKFSAVLAEAQKSAEVSCWNDVQDWNIAKMF